MVRKAEEIQIQVEYWPLERLKPYDRNPRVHSEEQLEQLSRSITEFGFLNPIIVAQDAGILAGHGRLEAANRLGRKTVPVIQVDHLDESQRRAFVMADNKIAANGGWDEDLLKEEIEALELENFDLELLGFSLPELEEITIGAEPTRRIPAGAAGGRRAPEPAPRLATPAAEASASPALEPEKPTAPLGPPPTVLPPSGPPPKKRPGKIDDHDRELVVCPNCSHRFPPRKQKVK